MMLLKKLIWNYNNFLILALIFIFSFFINYHYGFIGVMPMDSFVLYNGGYRILNGYVPFNDYWLVTGPLLDYLNSLFFFLLGTNWQAFIIHSSIFNSIISLVTYIVFRELGLEKKYSLLYSILFSILFYPVVGNPFVDHHSTFFVILAFYFFILGLNKANFFYYSFIPFFLVLAFLSKQTPAVYGILGIIILIITYLFFDKKKNIKTIKFLIVGFLVSIIFLLFFFYFTKIQFVKFYDQYLLYAKTIGDYRFTNYKFDFIGTIHEYKFILILLFFLVVITIKSWKKSLNNFFSNLAIIILSSLLIFHQYYTLNQNFIFFLIPLITGYIHVHYRKYYDKNYILALAISLCLFSTLKYHLRFNEHRKFNELEKVDLSKAIDAEILSQDLKGLQWITYDYKDNPSEEIENLLQIIEILKNDSTKKMIITDYQFISPILKIYDYSPNQWHHPSVSFPDKYNKYFKKYKNFFITNLKKNNIKRIYEITENTYLVSEMILNTNCFLKKNLNQMLTVLDIKKDCEDLK